MEGILVTEKNRKKVVVFGSNDRLPQKAIKQLERLKHHRPFILPIGYSDDSVEEPEHLVEYVIGKAIIDAILYETRFISANIAADRINRLLRAMKPRMADGSRVVILTPPRIAAHELEPLIEFPKSRLRIFRRSGKIGNDREGPDKKIIEAPRVLSGPAIHDIISALG
jgi:hypothetical protein